MRKHTSKYGASLWLSRHDTYEWANKSDAPWPCSFLANKTLFAEFEANGDLVDIVVNGGRGDQDCPADEFDAITSDFLA